MLDKIITWIKRMLGYADLNKDGTVNAVDVQIAKDKVEAVREAVESIAEEGQKVAKTASESAEKIEYALNAVRSRKPKR